MIRVKFSFHESSYGTLERLAFEHGVTEAEIVRRALQLYASLDTALKTKEQVIVTHEHMS